jgi:hypothetical protein
MVPLVFFLSIQPFSEARYIFCISLKNVSPYELMPEQSTSVVLALCSFQERYCCIDFSVHGYNN